MSYLFKKYICTYTHVNTMQYIDMQRFFLKMSEITKDDSIKIIKEINNINFSRKKIIDDFECFKYEYMIHEITTLLISLFILSLSNTFKSKYKNILIDGIKLNNILIEEEDFKNTLMINNFTSYKEKYKFKLTNNYYIFVSKNIYKTYLKKTINWSLKEEGFYFLFNELDKNSEKIKNALKLYEDSIFDLNRYSATNDNIKVSNVFRIKYIIFCNFAKKIK